MHDLLSRLAAPEQLASDRLRLRLFTVADHGLLLETLGDERVISDILPRPLPDAERCRQIAVDIVRRRELAREWTWVLSRHSAPDSPLGMLLMRTEIAHIFPRAVAYERPDRVNLGWFLTHRAWGEGLATEAGRCLEAWLLRQPAVASLSAITKADNAASIRVAEKLGFRWCADVDSAYPTAAGSVTASIFLRGSAD